MALFTVYGYADKTGANKAESADMWNMVKGCAKKFRARHRTGTVVLAGDLNAAKWSALDMDRQEAGMAGWLATDCLFKNGGSATKSRVVSTTNSNSIRSIKTAH